MSDSPLELPPNSDNNLELNGELERMTEELEKIIVQLTMMTYDIVALRTSPELRTSLQELQEAYHRCRDAICGNQQPDTTESPEPTDTLTQM